MKSAEKNKKSRLDKLKMPEKKSSMDMSELADDEEEPADEPMHRLGDDMPDDKSPEDEESPEHEAEESPEEEASEHPGTEVEQGEQHYLGDCSDDDLLAEVKKRGLMKQLAGEDDHNKSMDYGM